MRHDGWEADDLIGKSVIDEAYWTDEVVILSGDKDLLQLVDDHRVVQSGRARHGHWNRRRVIKEYGVEPEDVPLVLAMMGDTLDHIPGIKGVGVKTAAKYIRTHGASIDRICREEKRLNEEDTLVIRRNALLIDLRCVPDVPAAAAAAWVPPDHGVLGERGGPRGLARSVRVEAHQGTMGRGPVVDVVTVARASG